MAASMSIWQWKFWMEDVIGFPKILSLVESDASDSNTFLGNNDGARPSDKFYL